MARDSPSKPHARYDASQGYLPAPVPWLRADMQLRDGVPGREEINQFSMQDTST